MAITVQVHGKTNSNKLDLIHIADIENKKGKIFNHIINLKSFNDRTSTKVRLCIDLR